MSTAAATLDYGRNVEKIFGSCSRKAGPRRLAAGLQDPGAMATATALQVYRPRDAQQTVMHQVVKKYLPEFIEQAEMGGHSVPAFVQGELEAFIGCGDITRGFTHLKCPRCGHDRFLPFSCKTRTLCSSCAGRRMNETTLFLVDYVIGEIPLRHWALTFPPPLRYLFAYDSELCTKALNIFVHTVFGWQRRVAKRELGLDSVDQAVPAAITAIHRVGSAINLNLHLHSAIADGVFVQADASERPEFRALPAPEKADVVALAWEVCEKTTRMLQKVGKYFDADPSEADKLAQEYPLLAACYAASLQGSVAMGARAGQRVLRSGEYVEHGESDSVEQVRTLGHGFNLHAGMRVSASDKKGKERMLRYILRPPIATKHLTLGRDGRVIYWLKEAWADGSKCFTFEPLDFIAKLLPLIPPPRVNLTRYHGAWAAHSAIREKVVPHPTGAERRGQLVLPLPRRKKPKMKGGASAAGDGAGSDYRCGGVYQGGARLNRISWSDLAAKTFSVDTLGCERCGHSPLRVIAVVAAPTREQLEAVRPPGAVLTALSMRSRAPPGGQLELPMRQRLS